MADVSNLHEIVGEVGAPLSCFSRSSTCQLRYSGIDIMQLLKAHSHMADLPVADINCYHQEPTANVPARRIPSTLGWLLDN
ncbi:hypothetical protein J6590_015829 [Homalodisca vitripennis]|nr:hypothetical protein J6590_015829 [Homalodisca vitripennis]